jgi:hypothetical protein
LYQLWCGFGFTWIAQGRRKGQVIGEHLTPDFSITKLHSVNKLIFTRKNQKIDSLIKSLCVNFNVEKYKNEVHSYFYGVFNNDEENIRKRFDDNLVSLVSAAFYVTLRLKEIPITIKQVAYFLNQNPYLVGEKISILKKTFNLNVDACELSVYFEKLVDSFDSLGIEKKKIILSLSCRLNEFCRKQWIVSSRSPSGIAVGIISIAFCYALADKKYLDIIHNDGSLYSLPIYIKNRPNAVFSMSNELFSFLCSIMDIGTRSVKNIILEICDSLFRATLLPWIRRNNVCIYLEDILNSSCK